VSYEDVAAACSSALFGGHFKQASQTVKRSDKARLEHHAVASAEKASGVAEKQWHRGLLAREWTALLFGILSFMIAQIVVVSLHVQSTRLSHETEEIQLARDLYREFYAKDAGYLQVANAIEGCEKLYKGDGGKFGHVQINEYLGFFSDLGLFMERGALSEAMIGHFFGAFIIEAYEYPEVKSYIARIRKNFEQPDAFEDFDKVAKAVERDPRFARLAQFAKDMCTQQPEGN
jgi:hypothetical protein